MEKLYDCAIIGCGPAGVSAALYTARANLAVVVIGKAESALLKADRIDNFYGAGGVSGEALFQSGLAQLKELGVTQIEADVVNIDWENDFTLTLETDVRVSARSVIFCTGAKRVRAPIGNLAAYEGRGVSYCAICDAFFYRNKPVAVLGSGAYALHEAQTLLPTASSVCLLTNGEPISVAFPDAVRVIETPVASLEGADKLNGVCFTDGERIETSGLFIAIGTAGASDLARKLGVEVEGSNIVVNEHMETMLPGLFAAGDCTGGLLQVSKAVAEGAKAGLSAIRFLRGAARA